MCQLVTEKKNVSAQFGEGKPSAANLPDYIYKRAIAGKQGYMKS
jgi:hypothetical protein